MRHFPDGGKRRGSGALLDRTGASRHHPARSLSCPRPPRPDGAIRPFHRGCRSRFRRGGRRLLGSRCPGAPELGSMPASAISIGDSTSAATAIRWKSTKASSLVGGLYGVSLGRAFFGESMFHRSRDASKVALVHLVARLKAGHYRLLDTQFVTPHLRTFGAVEVSRPAYHKLLDAALVGEGNFGALDARSPGFRQRGAGAACRLLGASLSVRRWSR